MALPKIVLRGRKVILLSGFKDAPEDRSTKHRALVVDAEDKLRIAAKRNPGCGRLRLCCGRMGRVGLSSVRH